jgi:lysophospholipase L1-like esterase
MLARVLARIAYPLAAVLLGVGSIAALEIALRALGVAADAPRRDPFAGFSSAVPLFERAVRADGAAVWRLSPARQIRVDPRVPDEPQRAFLADPPRDPFRIFVIGDSSAAGHPYSTRYAFSTWLERHLRASLPGVDLEVVNAALAGYSSRRLVVAVEEIARHQPDLLIVYVGHNEWAERQYYGHLLSIPPALFRLLEWGYQTRLYAVALGLFEGLAPPAPPTVEDDAATDARQMFAVIRDRAGGVAAPSERELAYRDLLYEQNLRRMADTIRAVGGRLAFLTLGQNLSDWAPGASSHRASLAPDERERFDAHHREGARLAAPADGCEPALAEWERALAIDGEYALLHYDMARCQHRLRRLDPARAGYLRASDLDRVPHGAPSAYNALLRDLAREYGAVLVDVAALLERASGDRLVGDDLFDDFIHPNLRAHQRIGQAVFEALREADLPVPKASFGAGVPDLPDPDALLASEPLLATQRLESRLFLCLVARRDYCESDARALAQREPDSAIAQQVLAGLRAGG